MALQDQTLHYPVSTLPLKWFNKYCLADVAGIKVDFAHGLKVEEKYQKLLNETIQKLKKSTDWPPLDEVGKALVIIHFILKQVQRYPAFC